MSYFEDSYESLRLPIASPGKPGLRRAQLGAIHSIAGHFTLHNEPALVVMPTGSGKTAVLMAAAFVLRADRVLVVTPSRLVRDQIREQFAGLEVLKGMGVLPKDISSPKVYEVRKRIDSVEEWEGFREFNVVVATPNSASPGISGIPLPPEDLFDLILVDEAHHSPAHTWDQLFRSFPRAKRLLVTATPFRRDRREIRGRLIYEYPLSEAYKDEVFGKIEFVRVDAGGTDPDVATAKAAEAELKKDRDFGFRHFLMVRTDSRKKADELLTTYEQNTALRLRVIHSEHSYGRVKTAIANLKAGSLDGVICVNMMGEGFDFPNLKLAAIHAPHKSLAVTLQFIGRFARTNADDVGSAKFIAVPQEIEIESRRLYEEDAAWQEIVINLSRTRIDEEVYVRETLEGFESRGANELELEDLSLFSLRPYFHVKVYRMTGAVKLMAEPWLPGNFDVPHRWDNPDLNATVFVAREHARPKWATTDHFLSATYHLFVVCYDPATRLLFINSSVKQAEIYEELAHSLTDGYARILPLNQINRVIAGMNDPEFFNIGMRNRLQSTSAESYRIVTGPAAQKAIQESDGQMYHRGHVFGGDGDETIGFSSGSKVWSNSRNLIPKLLAWCGRLSAKLADASAATTNSELDHLGVGETIDAIPDGVIGALWDIDVFKKPPKVIIAKPGSKQLEIGMLDFDLVVDQANSGPASIRITLSNAGLRIDLDYRLRDEGWEFAAADDAQVEGVSVERAHSNVDLVAYLNAHPLSFFFSDFSSLYGNELFSGPGGKPPSLPDDRFNVVDWAAHKVDIEREFGAAKPGMVSIHAHLEAQLPAAAEIVFYDHGSGEVADFITFDRKGAGLEVALYHCKGSSGTTAGNRVSDYYEVCGQVVKSLRWIENQGRLLAHILKRAKGSQRFVKGDGADLEKLIEDTRRSKVSYRLVIVQPGILRGTIGELGPNLAAASDYVVRCRGQQLDLWCSK